MLLDNAPANWATSFSQQRLDQYIIQKMQSLIAAYTITIYIFYKNV